MNLGPHSRPRLLFVTPVSPFNASSGAAQRSRLLLQAIQEDCDIDVLELHEGSALNIRQHALGELTTAIDGKGAITKHVIATVPASRNPLLRFEPQVGLKAPLEAALDRPFDSYALTVGRYLWPISQLPLPLGSRTLGDWDDWRYRVQGGATYRPAQVVQRVRKALAHRLSRQAVGRFTAAFSVSSQDHQELTALLPVTALPNAHPHAVADLGPTPHGSRLLFVGAMWYGPNAEAMDWFLRRVWPLVRSNRPDAELLIAGAASPSALAAWASHPGVEAPGFVTDLSACYQNSSLVLLPMLRGGGTNIKLLEAMAHRRPCLVSPLVAAAFADRLQADRHFLVAMTPEEFADAALEALRNPQALQAMTDRAWEAVHLHYSPQQFLARARQAVQELILGGAA